MNFHFLIWTVFGTLKHWKVCAAMVSSLNPPSSVSRWIPSLAHGQGNRCPNTATAWHVATRLMTPSQSLAGPQSVHDETAMLLLKCPVTGDLAECGQRINYFANSCKNNVELTSIKLMIINQALAHLFCIGTLFLIMFYMQCNTYFFYAFFFQLYFMLLNI